MQPKKREGRVVLVGTKRFEKGGTSIKGRAIGGWEAYIGLGIIRVIRQGVTICVPLGLT